MKIGFILPLNGISGGIYVVYHHASYLSSIGHEVTIIFASDIFGIKIKSVQNCTLKTIKLEDVVNSGISFDILIATWWETYYEMFQIQAAHYMYFCQSDERRFYTSRMSYEVPFVEHTYLNKNVGIITMARWIVDWLKEEFKIESEYAPNGIDLSLFNPDVTPLEAKKDKIRVLIEGPGSVFFKRIDMAFKVANRFSNIEVWYVCNDDYLKPEWKFDRMFSRLSLDEMPPIYASCDILLKLSSVESFSYPPLEMMACGGAAVVAKFTGHEEYLEHEENALLVEVDDEEGAYIALKRLLEDTELRLRLAQNGVQTAKKLTWEDKSPLFASVLEKIKAKELYVMKAERNHYILINNLRKLQLNQSQLQETQNQLKKNQNQLQETQNHLNSILNSNSFKIGRACTYIPRNIKKILK